MFVSWERCVLSFARCLISWCGHMQQQQASRPRSPSFAFVMGKKVAAAAAAPQGSKPAKAPAPKVKAPDMKAKTAAPPKAAPAATDDGEKKKGGKQRKRSDIDDIFGLASGSAEPDTKAIADGDGELKEVAERIKKARAAKLQPAAKAAGSKAAPAVQGSKDDLFGAESGKNRKRTEEGYTVYTEDELGLNKQGGDTDLCPFDCDCCY